MAKETDKEVSITYEALFELLRREKNRDELQPLQESFMQDVTKYLDGKKNSLQELQATHDLMSDTKKQRAQQELNNIRRIVTELYERREKKVISMALNKSRTASSIIDTSALLPQEKAFFESLVIILDQFRDDILKSMFNNKATLVQQPVKEEKEEPKELLQKVKLTTDLPKFMGPDKNVYGPFMKDDETELPEIIAKVLKEKGRIEFVE